MLSAREREVLAAIAVGESDREIAMRLQVSHSTIRKHRENMMLKLGFKKSSQLVIHHYTRYELPDEAAKKIA